ncbi:polysaccharide deacetylase family protein [Ammoniphilus resinae]|uniref:Peptidoglycan/xylan/chitin deacetylase (PgdA/CDA1 family) n=1 Tax=Ammoniphilus resinae TaxID=861532 RepID=A0ABS4GID4_9BACL|nr:peptidoglycan/xylan/chitin deacetylase (PgdA/CDA1 family) [Ammoniphilus resinae]
MKRFIGLFLSLIIILVPNWGQAATQQATPILKIDTDEKIVAITFDDGPDPKYTPIILEILHEQGVRATFFVLGNQAEGNDPLLQWMVKAGHEIGNHGYSHPNMKKLTRAEVYTQIKKAERVILSATGKKPECYRPPGGVITPAILRATYEAGYELIHWSIDPKDWKKSRTAEVITGSLKNKVGAGDIVLFHDGGVNQEESIKALVPFIEDLREQGYRFVTVSEMMEME